MIQVEKLKQVTEIFCHGKCADGLASAMILQDAFRMLGMAPPIRFLTHNTPEHKAAGATVTCSTTDAVPAWSRPLFCDIAPHHNYGSAQGCRDNGAIVLDHHVGTKELVESFGENGVYADAEKEPGVSGAVLAWRVWETINTVIGEHDFLLGSVPIQTKAFAEFVGARDTWQTRDHRFLFGQWISKALMSKPPEFWLGGDRRAPMPFLTDQETQNGRALFEAHEDAVRQAVEQCVEYEVPCATPPGFASGGAIRLFVFQEQAVGFRLCSDVAEALRERPPHFQAVVAGFYYAVDKPGSAPQLNYSLRGIGGFDVQKLAAANGGNGHKPAAGFAVTGYNSSPPDPYCYIRERLRAFLKRTGRGTP